MSAALASLVAESAAIEITAIKSTLERRDLLEPKDIKSPKNDCVRYAEYAFIDTAPRLSSKKRYEDTSASHSVKYAAARIQKCNGYRSAVSN
ncbi:hypothetical protein [Afipia sp. GAS231]|uniref:hypothetical protein n=1 Tax=Afipia sp. GAS231 TaxID=1882747 RepID=UPI0015607595|nr:hypothetical protein [Afipia sp. GAS231]